MADRDINEVASLNTLESNDKLIVSDVTNGGASVKKVNMDVVANFIMENYIKINMNYDNS